MNALVSATAPITTVKALAEIFASYLLQFDQPPVRDFIL